MTFFGSPPGSLHALLVAALLGRGGLAPAQATVGAGAVTGTVLDAASSRPLDGAHVVLEPAAASPGGFPVLVRTVVTDDAGRYRFERVAAGPYRLHVRSNSYRTTTLDGTGRVTVPPVTRVNK